VGQIEFAFLGNPLLFYQFINQKRMGTTGKDNAEIRIWQDSYLRPVSTAFTLMLHCYHDCRYEQTRCLYVYRVCL